MGTMDFRSFASYPSLEATVTPEFHHWLVHIIRLASTRMILVSTGGLKAMGNALYPLELTTCSFLKFVNLHLELLVSSSQLVILGQSCPL